MAIQWIVDSKQFYERMLALTERWRLPVCFELVPADWDWHQREFSRNEKVLLRYPQHYKKSFQYIVVTPEELK